MINVLKPLIKTFTIFAKNNLNFKKPPRLFLKQDSSNANCALGKTAHYDPQEKAITIFISGRHPKDILRSYAHELVHHCQNERGDLRLDKMKTLNKNYAQENDHMRKMEEEAYLHGNMCFRDWEDGLDDKTQYKIAIAEQKFLKENNNMSVKISKEDLKSLIKKLLENKLQEGSCGKRKSKKCGPDCPGCSKCRPEMNESEEEVEEGKEKKTKSSKGKTPKTAKEKKFAALAEPKNKITYADKIAGAVAEDVETFRGQGNTDSVDNMTVPYGQSMRYRDELPSSEEILSMTEEEARNKWLEHGCEFVNVGTSSADDIDYCDALKAKAESATGVNMSVGLSEKVNTPEQENTLYEARFAPKNTRLFEKLLKEWTR
jgi:hypothetical protein